MGIVLEKYTYTREKARDSTGEKRQTKGEAAGQINIETDTERERGATGTSVKRGREEEKEGERERVSESGGSVCL